MRLVSSNDRRDADTTRSTGVAAAEALNEMPHSTTTICAVAGVAICSNVLMAAPVATATCAAVVGLAPLNAI